MKILVIPDIHGSTKWKATAPYWHKFDRVVFLGDYVDSLTIDPTDIYKNLIDIFDTARNHNNIDMLIGNHDAYYFMYNPIRGGGYRMDYHDRYNMIFTENYDMLKLSTQYTVGNNTIMFSHAGIISEWVRFSKSVFAAEYGFEYEMESIKDLTQFIQDISDTRISHVIHASKYRGGMAPVAGPLWAHYSELISDPYPNLIQVVGHTELKELIDHTDTTNKSRCIFADLGMDSSKTPFLVITLTNDVKLQSVNAEMLKTV